MFRAQKVEEIYKWLSTNRKERETKHSLMKRLRTSPRLFDQVEIHWREDKEKHQREIMEQLGVDVNKRPAPDEIINRNFINHLRKEVMEPGAPAAKMELFAKIQGILVEKQEIKHKFDASDFARAAREADRQLREGNYRVAEVSEKLPILPDKLCETPGQGERTDSQL